MITRLIGRRRDETAASVLSTAARDGTSARSLERKRAFSFFFSFFFIYSRTAPCAAAVAGRDCNRNTAVVREGAIGGEEKKKKEEYTLYTAVSVYNFISRRPGAPRRDRRHAHLCVSWAPAQVASPFVSCTAARLMLLLLLLPLFLPTTRIFVSFLPRRPVCRGQVVRRMGTRGTRTRNFPRNFRPRVTRRGQTYGSCIKKYKDKKEMKCAEMFFYKCKKI